MAYRFLASVSIEATDALAAAQKLRVCGLSVLYITPMDPERDGEYRVQLGDVGIGKIRIIIAIRGVLPFGLRETKEAVESGVIDRLTQEEAEAVKRVVAPFTEAEVIHNPS